MKAKASGFTLVELIMLIAIIGILVAVALPAYLEYTKGECEGVACGTYTEAVKLTEKHMGRTIDYWKDSDTDVCDLNESAFIDFLGGLSLGTVLTANAAGNSIFMALTASGGVVIVTPAVATAVTLAAGTAAATYGGIKGYCAIAEAA